MPTHTNLSTFKEMIREDSDDRNHSLRRALDAAEGLVFGRPGNGAPDFGLLGRATRSTTLVELFDDFSCVWLDYPDDVTAISVEYTDDTGAAETVDDAVYELLDSGQLILRPGQSWPASYDVVRVTYTVHLASVPDAALGAAYMAAGWFAEHPYGEVTPANLRKTLALMLGPDRRTAI